MIETIFEDSGTDLFGEADNETEVMKGSEAVEFGFLVGVAGAPHRAEATERPAGAAGGAVAARVENLADIGELA